MPGISCLQAGGSTAGTHAWKQLRSLCFAAVLSFLAQRQQLQGFLNFNELQSSFIFSSNISALTKVIADLSLLDKSFPCHCEISSACLFPQNKGWWTSKTSWTTTSQCRTASWTILLSVWIQRWIAPTATQGLEWQKPLLNTFLRRCYKR